MKIIPFDEKNIFEKELTLEEMKIVKKLIIFSKSLAIILYKKIRRKNI